MVRIKIVIVQLINNENREKKVLSAINVNFVCIFDRLNVSSEFKKIQESADLVDITFSCDGKQFGAHKLVLFACSPYFREILKVSNNISRFQIFQLNFI